MDRDVPRDVHEHTSAQGWEIERSLRWEKGAKGIAEKKARSLELQPSWGGMKAERAGEGLEQAGVCGRGPSAGCWSQMGPMMHSPRWNGSALSDMLPSGYTVSPLLPPLKSGENHKVT